MVTDEGAKGGAQKMPIPEENVCNAVIAYETCLLQKVLEFSLLQTSFSLFHKILYHFPDSEP